MTGLARKVDAIMLFDGTCAFCSRSVLFVLRHSAGKPLVFSAAQSAEGQGWLRRLGMPLEEFETFAVIDGGRVYTKSEGALRVMCLMGAPWSFLASMACLVPRALRDRLYDAVARNRYRLMGRRCDCFAPPKGERHRFLA
ncbi:MAG: DCC1-like thiol-disulfide oxidoreductase family protein [Proteobacteria bacterium]|nr:DCC1-like thiol-disulfide oxidoreductase family protein [Pseudomonadota bacterium]